MSPSHPKPHSFHPMPLKGSPEYFCFSWECQLRRHHRALQRCRRQASERHVHDLRITTRRLLAQLDHPRPAAARRERRRLKHLMRITAPARDARVHVLLLNRLTRGRRPPDLEKFHRHLGRRERRFARELGHTLAERLLRPDRTPPLPPVTTTAARAALRRAFARLQRRLRLARSRGDPDALHRARAAAKQCRYLAEATGTGQRQLTELRTLQSALGQLHDLDLFLARIETYAARHRRVAAWLRRHRAALRRHRERLWRSLPPNPAGKEPGATNLP